MPRRLGFIPNIKALSNRVGERLFAVDVLTGFHRIEDHRRVLVLGAGDRHVIDLFEVQQRAIVLHRQRSIDLSSPFFSALRPTIRNCHEIEIVWHGKRLEGIQMIITHVACADKPHANAIVRTEDSCIATSRHSQRRPPQPQQENYDEKNDWTWMRSPCFTFVSDQMATEPVFHDIHPSELKPGRTRNLLYHYIRISHSTVWPTRTFEKLTVLAAALGTTPPMWLCIVRADRLAGASPQLTRSSAEKFRGSLLTRSPQGCDRQSGKLELTPASRSFCRSLKAVILVR